MLQKKKFKSIIEKYYLNGFTEAVKVVIKNKKIEINFSPKEEKCLLGKIVSDIDLPDSEFGIFDTTQLLKLIKIINNDLAITLDNKHGVITKMLIQDHNYDLEYHLADIMLIDKVAKIKEPPSYELQILLDLEFFKRFTEGKKALGDISRFTIESDLLANNVIFTLGEPSNLSNKVKFNIQTTNTPDISAIPFSASVFLEILEANWEATKGTLQLNKQGLIKLSFEEDGIIADYYLVRLE